MNFLFPNSCSLRFNIPKWIPHLCKPLRIYSDPLGSYFQDGRVTTHLELVFKSFRVHYSLLFLLEQSDPHYSLRLHFPSPILLVYSLLFTLTLLNKYSFTYSLWFIPHFFLIYIFFKKFFNTHFPFPNQQPICFFISTF